MHVSYRVILLHFLVLTFVPYPSQPLLAASRQSLFNGRNLKGWTGDEKIWSVQDGQIVGTTVGNRIEANTFLVWSGGTVGDFRLTFKARLDGNNNSGVQYRSKLTNPKTWRVTGYQADMHSNPEYTAMLYSEGTGRGIVARRGQKVVVQADSGDPKVVGQMVAPPPVDVSQWHEYMILAKGNRLIHLIDGKVAVDVTDNHPDKLDRGILALQVHVGPPMTVFFKDIELEKLSTEDDGHAIEILHEETSKTNSKPKNITSVAPEFQVEKVLQVPQSMGSWVSLAADNQGRLIASDQGNKGLYLITPNPIGSSNSTQVEKLPVDLSGAQGLTWAFDSLYAMTSFGPAPGLHRLTDTDGDGKLDTTKRLKSISGEGEHGTHAVVLAPDKKSLYVVAGNHTSLPKDIKRSRMPRNWGEDLLLPRQWDPRGHATGKLAPGGWICKVDPTGKSWEIISAGYRNQYDIAFNADGELFTYDSDMEWDLGLPWYRPTRLLHATSGSEFGWRGGTGKWPTYYEDSLPPVMNLGPGSPTGMTFGYGAKFPAKYQQALFLLDWTFGTIYAVHLTPDGASYSGQKEDFITGIPLPVTDTVIGADGALYFIVGGRGTQSALYRVTYTGELPTAPVQYQAHAGSELRDLRHTLEAQHGSDDIDLDLVFTNLRHSDRFIRYAARIALESKPIDTWQNRALAETNPQGAITAMMALARQGKPQDLEPILQTLDRIDLAAATQPVQLALLRAYGLAFARLGEPSETTRQRLIAKWDPLYPSNTETGHFNMELAQLLVYLRSPSVIEKTLTHVEQLGAEPIPDWAEATKREGSYSDSIQSIVSNMPPTQAIHYMFTLRNVETGWTRDQHSKYFTFFIQAAKHPGGASYVGFLENMRKAALENCSKAERVLLGPLVDQPLSAETYTPTPPKGPGRNWTKQAALKVLSGNLKERDLKQGRNLFHAVTCAKCHRLNGEGGAIGPDLSTAARKFSLSDLLDSILDPNKVISDQYGSHLIQTDDGLTVTGRAIEIDDEIHVFTQDMDVPPIVIPRANVAAMSVSNISQMPTGLVDSLNPEELKDLVAYILSIRNKDWAGAKNTSDE